MKLSLGKSKRSAEQQSLENLVIPTPSLCQRITQSWFDAIPSLWGNSWGLRYSNETEVNFFNPFRQDYLDYEK